LLLRHFDSRARAPSSAPATCTSRAVAALSRLPRFLRRASTPSMVPRTPLPYVPTMSLTVP
jgi:hypothetical protein